MRVEIICSISGRLSKSDNGNAGILLTILCIFIPFHSSEIMVPCKSPGCLVAEITVVLCPAVDISLARSAVCCSVPAFSKGGKP